MIVGVGLDICRVDPIRRSIDRFGKAWLDEVFSEAEQARLGSCELLAHQAAIGFALKEASSKAIGTGFDKGVRRQDILVESDGTTNTVHLIGVAKRRAEILCGTPALAHLQSLVRSTTVWVSALVILESAPSRTALGGLDIQLPLPP